MSEDEEDRGQEDARNPSQPTEEFLAGGVDEDLTGGQKTKAK